MSRQHSIELNAIAAMCTTNNGIGKNNDLPWHLPQDFKYFLRFITPPVNKLNALIVGRLTWLSMTELDEYKLNLIVIVSSKLKHGLETLEYKSYDPNRIFVTESFQEAVDLLLNNYSHLLNSIIAIGGTKIYGEAIRSPNFHRFYLTRIFSHFECDTFIKPNDLLLLKRLNREHLGRETQVYQCQYNVPLTNNNGIDFVFEVYASVSSDR